MDVDVAVVLLLCVCVQSAPAKTIAASRQVKKGTVKLAAAGLCSCRVRESAMDETEDEPVFSRSGGSERLLGGY